MRGLISPGQVDSISIFVQRCGSDPGSKLSQEAKIKKGTKLRARVTGPSGRDQKFSQLAAERMMLNFDHMCCASIRQRGLVLFVRAGVPHSPLSTPRNYTSIRAGARAQALQLPLYFSALTLSSQRREHLGEDK